MRASSCLVVITQLSEHALAVQGRGPVFDSMQVTAARLFTSLFCFIPDEARYLNHYLQLQPHNIVWYMCERVWECD